MHQFKPQILFLQRPLEQEDVRAIVFNDQNPDREIDRRIFQARSPFDNQLAALSSFHTHSCQG